MMKKNIIAIPGSTRLNSINHTIIKAIAELIKEKYAVSLFDGLASLPHFNPDNLNNPPEQVIHFKQLLNQSDGIIICTPEYAHGVPGTLKNAIDWTVSTSEFSGKTTLLITASTDGQHGHKALLEILRVIEAKNIDELQLLIQFIKAKVNAEGMITDEKTFGEIKAVLEKFDKTLEVQIQ